MAINDIMIDIETLGKAPHGAVLSVGAVAFDRVTGYVGNPESQTAFYTVVDMESAVTMGKVDGVTARWWMRQSDEARENVCSGSLSLATALDLLKLFIDDIARACPGLPINVWGNGPTFDITILESAYETVGKEAPWHFRNVRDFRTLRDLAGPVEPLPGEGISHNALSDATWQARMAVLYFRALRGEIV